MQHPDKNVEFTDYFNQPINAGDIIVYPTCSGSSSAVLTEAKISEVVPLVEKPGEWISTGPQSRIPAVREDQLMAGKRYPTEYPVRNDDWRKAYVLVVRTKNAWGDQESDGYSKRRYTVKNVSNVVVAPS